MISLSEQPLKILICKPSSLGDVVQAMVVLRHLKASFPKSKIYWWIASGLSPLLKDDSDLDGIFLFDREAVKRFKGVWGYVTLVRQIRRMHFDLILDLQALVRSAFFAWLCGGNKVVGLDDRREWAPLFYNQAVQRPTPDAHAVDWYLEVLRKIKIPIASKIDWIPENREVMMKLKSRFSSIFLSERKRVILQPNTRWASKEWPVEHFIAMAKHILELRKDVVFSILGSNADCQTGEQISRALGSDRVDNLCGELSLPEMVEWIRCSDFMVTNDTGPMHVAAALGKPMAALFGATNPYRTGPYAQMGNVITAKRKCSPCLKKSCPFGKVPPCMEEIRPEIVSDFVLKHL